MYLSNFFVYKIGFSQKKKEKIFKVYFRLKNKIRLFILLFLVTYEKNIHVSPNTHD